MHPARLSSLLVLALPCFGANTEVHCKNETDWSALVQGTSRSDVCEQAQSLLSDCPGATLPPLPPNGWYHAWDFSPRGCACTMVMYNLLSACAGCQRGSLSDAGNYSWPSVSQYKDSTCNFRHQDALPVKPENGSDAWSELPWANSSGTTFNLQQALSTTEPPSPPALTIPPAPTQTNTETPVAHNAATKHGPNIGAIAGGVIGAVVFLGAIFGLLVCLRRRKRHAHDVAPSDEFLKPEYYISPPLLPAQARRDSEYQDEIEEEAIPPISGHRLSWVGGMVTTRRRDEHDGDEALPPFTQGTYIGPTPHEKGHAERRDTNESDATVTSNTHLLASQSQPDASERARG